MNWKHFTETSKRDEDMMRSELRRRFQEIEDSIISIRKEIIYAQELSLCEETKAAVIAELTAKEVALKIQLCEKIMGL